jgi:predicted Zn-dependent protease
MSSKKYRDILNWVKDNNKFRLFDIRDIGIVIIIELIVWSMIKVYNNLMIMRSKVDKNLTSKLSSVVGSLWVVNILKDSQIINAFCMTKTNNIFITSAMIEKLKLSENEIIAMMLHEVGHGHEKYQKITRDLPRWTAEYSSLRLIEFVLGKDYFFIAQMSNLIMSAMMTLTVFPISRIYEYRADDFATKHGYGKYLKSAFKKLISYCNKNGRQIINPKKSKFAKLIVILEGLFSTHPNTYKRIEEIEKNMKKNISKQTNLSETIQDAYKVSGLPPSKKGLISTAISFVTRLL